MSRFTESAVETVAAFASLSMRWMVLLGAYAIGRWLCRFFANPPSPDIAGLLLAGALVWFWEATRKRRGARP